LVWRAGSGREILLRLVASAGVLVESFKPRYGEPGSTRPQDHRRLRAAARRASQFTDLKEKCLAVCRHPAAFLMRGYRRGAGQAFRLGLEHALFCLGCCWALTLLMFAVGITNLLWMAPMTLRMFYPRAGRWRERLVAPVGVGLVAFGVFGVVVPETTMPLLASGESKLLPSKAIPANQH
jgi:hypothetical protein